MQTQIADNHFNEFFNNAAIRGFVDNRNVTWVYATDIANLLEYRNAYTMCCDVNPCEKQLADIETPGGIQKGIFITENALYDVIARSKHPRAVEFNNWVRYEVLPCIKKYGIYISPSTLAMLEANPNIIEDLSAQVKEFQHKAQLKRMYHLIDKSRSPFCEFGKLEEMNTKLKDANIEFEKMNTKLKTALTNMENKYYDMYMQAKGVNQMFDHFVAAMM